MTVEEKGQIAVLVTDTPHEQTSPIWGDYGDQGISLLQPTPQLTGYEFVKYNVITKMEYPSEADLESGKIKGIYVTGSKFDSFAQDEWILTLKAFLQRIYKNYTDIPLVGVCFGHQIIAVALGVMTTRNPKGWELGVSEIKTNPAVQESIPKFPKTFNVVEFHLDIVPAAPEGTVSIGSTDTCQVQGFYKKGRVLTFQGHPEFKSECCQILAEVGKKKGYVSDEALAEITHRNSTLTNDQQLLGDILADFLVDK